MRSIVRRSGLSAAAVLIVVAGCTTSSAPQTTASGGPSATSDGGQFSGWEDWAEFWDRANVEYTAAVVQCLRDKGWAVDHEEGTIQYGIEYSDPERQQPLFRAADSDCGREAVARGYTDPGTRVWDGTTLRFLYDYNVDRYQCLLNAGYDIPTPPSFEAWLDTYQTGQGEIWIPYRYLPRDWLSKQAAESACPQAQM